MFSAEAHEERRASAPTPTSRVPTSRVSYHRQWLADNFGHGHDKLIQTKKREVRSAAATELKLGVLFYEMYVSFLLTTFVRDSHSNSTGRGATPAPVDNLTLHFRQIHDTGM